MAIDPQLRRATADDVDAIRALTRLAYAKWVPVIGREPWPMTADYALAVERHRIDLAYLDGALAGLVETISQPGHLLIENVAVSPAFQGRGLGGVLLARAEALAAAGGYDQIRLYTNQRFTSNIALYLRRGYRIDREETHAAGVSVHMSKQLGLGTGPN